PGDDHFSRYIVPLRLHIAGGAGALLAGPWQFCEKLRGRFQPAPLVGALVLVGSRAWSNRRVRDGCGFRARTTHSPWLRNVGRIVVFHWPASLSDGAARKHPSVPPVDDPQLRVDPCGGHAP